MARGPGPSPHTATDIYGHGNPIADTETGTKTRGHRGALYKDSFEGG